MRPLRIDTIPQVFAGVFLSETFLEEDIITEDEVSLGRRSQEFNLQPRKARVIRNLNMRLSEVSGEGAGTRMANAGLLNCTSFQSQLTERNILRAAIRTPEICWFYGINRYEHGQSQMFCGSSL